MISSTSGRNRRPLLALAALLLLAGCQPRQRRGSAFWPEDASWNIEHGQTGGGPPPAGAGGAPGPAGLNLSWGNEPTEAAEWQPVIVREVLAGGVLRLANRQRVKLIGVRLPDPATPIGQEARRYLRRLVEDRSVRLEFDQRRENDRNELLAYAYLMLPLRDAEGRLTTQDVPVNTALLFLGLARLEESTPNRRYSEAFALVEEEAREAGRGLWTGR